jgi:hypothetical protein
LCWRRSVMRENRAESSEARRLPVRSAYTCPYGKLGSLSLAPFGRIRREERQAPAKSRSP